MSMNISEKEGSSKGSCQRWGVTFKIRYFIWALCLAVGLVGVILIITATKSSITDAVLPPEEDAVLPPEEDSVMKSEHRSYRHGSVVTDTDICSRIGSEILATYGGSAVDAFVATALCVGVVNHHSCGIGGGFLATLYAKPKNGSEKEMASLMAREVAPLLATIDMYVNSTADSLKGGRAIAVPGEIAGYYEAWQAYGKIDWAQLFQPTIDLCKEGYKVEKGLSKVIATSENEIRDDESLSELFVKPDGELIQEGDILKNPKLAQTLERIAEDPTSFYNGSLAEDIVLDIQDAGGIITMDDLHAYTAKWKTPLQTQLVNGNYTIYSPPPPSSGAVLQFILGILDGFDFGPSSLSTTDARIKTYHRIVEAFKFAYGKRSSLGDEDFVDVRNLVANMTNPTVTNSIRTRINEDRTEEVAYYDPAFENSGQDLMGTSHMNVYASDGSAVSLTSTINYWFGSKVRGKRTGIIFNDEMDDFSTPGTRNGFGYPASPSNYIVPEKMPQSSMSPSVVLDNNSDVVLLVGASGGSRIISATAQVIINNLWFKLGPAASADEPRLHHQLDPNVIQYESNFDQAVLTGLSQKGHTLKELTSAASGFIHKNCSIPEDWEKLLALPLEDWFCLQAVSDKRKGGAPDGY